MPHNFKDFPELTNRQMEIYYFESPHKQITDNFMARVEKVIDGDTIRVSTEFRDFIFRVRFANTAAPEKDEEGGLEARAWLAEQIQGEEVYIGINYNNRVGKWGRILGTIYHRGLNINEMLINSGHAIEWL